jgi:hypothetical protein
MGARVTGNWPRKKGASQIRNGWRLRRRRRCGARRPVFLRLGRFKGRPLFLRRWGGKRRWLRLLLLLLLQKALFFNPSPEFGKYMMKARRLQRPFTQISARFGKRREMGEPYG